MTITTTIILKNSTILTSSDIKLHFSGDFVRVTEGETNHTKFYQSSEIIKITQIDSSITEELKTGRRARIDLINDVVSSSGSIMLSGASFIALRDAGTTTWFPAHQIQEIEINPAEIGAADRAKYGKLLNAALIRHENDRIYKCGDVFTVETTYTLNVKAGWLSPEGNFIFVRDYVNDREFWYPNHVVKNIDFRS